MPPTSSLVRATWGVLYFEGASLTPYQAVESEFICAYVGVRASYRAALKHGSMGG